MNKKIKLSLIIILFLVSSLILTQAVLAKNVGWGGMASDYLDKIAGNGSINIKTNASPAEIVGKIINGVLGFLGILFLVIMLYAGFTWMNAGGSEEDVTQARNLIKWSIIGVIVLLGAYAISYYVVVRINEAANAPRPLTPNINIEGEEDDILDPVDINYIDCTEVQSSCAGCGRDEYCCANLGSCCVFKHGSCAVPN